MVFLDNIKTGKINLEEVKNVQEDFNELLKKMRKGNKSADQRKTLANIDMFFNWRNDSIKFVEDYGLMILRQKGKQPKGKDLKH